MKNKIKNIKPLYLVLFHVKKCLLFLWLYICNLYDRFTKKQVQDIAELKNIHYGKRCFIIATGPSLTIDDLEKLKNEHTISMNSIVNMFEQTEFRPTYYVIQDEIVEKRLRDTILASDLKEVLIGVGNAPGFKINISKRVAHKFYQNRKTFNLNLAYHFFDMYYHQDRAKTGFSEDCSFEVMDGYTVTYSAIELAVYMGFKEIYLLGCDTNHAGHIDKKSNSSNSYDPLLMNIKAYVIAKKYADEHGIKIFNATRGGMLEVYQRINLDDLL